tara:strand:- start:837 stop:1124 length:288 start_codon:yes stop_codon:yes gene_type:complete
MQISNMTKGEWGKVRAFFDLQTEDGFTLKGFKLVEGSSGLFVGFPSQKNKDGEYKDTIYADKILKQKINKLALDYYNKGESTNQSGSSQSDDIPF